jgi:AcrR family transcriptional regulator
MRRPTSDRQTRLAQAVALRLEGQKEIDIAAALGVNVSTVSEYLNSEEGRELLAAGRERLLTSAAVGLAALVEEAVSTLRRNLDCGLPAVERQAAVDVLKLAGLAGKEPTATAVATAVHVTPPWDVRQVLAMSEMELDEFLERQARVLAGSTTEGEAGITQSGVD